MGGHNRRPKRALVADIGGTNARFALADLSTLALGTCRQISCADHESLDAALGDYLGALPERPEGAAMAVAAPVTSDAIRLTNAPWSFTREQLCRATGLDEVLLRSAPPRDGERYSVELRR